MNTKTCAACGHWVESECRAQPPISSEGGRGVWPVTAATDWCGRFAPRERKRGHAAKITDQQVIDAVKVYDTTTGPDGKAVDRMAVKRSDLIFFLMELGITQTPALRRIEKLVRYGILESGNNPWPRTYPTPGIYVWLAAVPAEVVPSGKPAQAPAAAKAEFIRLVRQMASTPETAMSLRSIVREIDHTLPISVATASRWMTALIADGLAAKNEAGYYAAPLEVG